MTQIFVKRDDFLGNRVFIKDRDFHHLVRVRRIKKNHSVFLRDEKGVFLTGKVIAIKPSWVELEIVSEERKVNFFPKLTLGLSLLKARKIDLVVQKVTELGIHKIVPLVTERSVPEVDFNKKKIKLERWRKIAAEAAKQSLRKDLVIIEEIISFDYFIGSQKSGAKFIAQPGSKGLLQDQVKDFRESEDFSLLIGPEGGFSAIEINKALAQGWLTFNFGFTNLKAETAAIVLPALILQEWFRKNN